MAPFGDYISRSDAAPIMMPEEVSNEIFEAVENYSIVDRLATRAPNMAASQRRIPVLSVLPNVYFVGEKGRSPQTFGALKQTTEQQWQNKYLNAEEMACIVVVPENVLDDEEFDVWESVKPQIAGAIAAKKDNAIFFGENNVTVPVAWPDGLLVGMPADHLVPVGTNADLYSDIFGVGGVFSKFEEDGFMATGHVADLTMRARLRDMRDGNGNLVYVQDMRSSIPYSLDGTQLEWAKNGSWDPTTALMLSGDFSQLIWCVRRDVDFKIFTTGVITDDSNNITHNLLQEDLIALRVTFRMAWQLPNPINRVNTNSATRYPFAALTPAGSS